MAGIITTATNLVSACASSLANAGRRVFDHPSNAFRILLAILLGLSFVFLCYAWVDNLSTRVPLILLGTTGILIIVADTSSTIARTAAIVIVGTVVADEGFLITLADVMRGNPDAAERYYERQIEGETRLSTSASSPPLSTTADLAQAAEQELLSDSTTITKVLTQNEIVALLRRLRVKVWIFF